MKSIKLALIALFLGLATAVHAQVNLNELVDSVCSNPGDAAALVEAAVRAEPERVHEIVEALLANCPALAEEIMLGALAGLPDLTEDLVYLVVQRAILAAPGLAPEIALGARRATTGMETVINRSAVDTLRLIAIDSGQRGIPPGQRRASAIPGVFIDGSILSPSST